VLAAGLPLAVLAIAAVWWFAGREPERPNIVLITLESVRADHLGCYGYAKPTSPAVDALAREGMLYENAHAVTSWTLPTHASLFTGLYPGAHQVVGPFDRLADGYPTLAEVLAANGYHCGGVISGPYLSKAHGLHKGFSYYNESASAESQTMGHSKSNSDEVEAALRHFVTRLRDRKRPFFLFGYFWDPHYDYIPPAPYDRLFVTGSCEPIDVRDYETGAKVTPACTPGQLEFVVSQYDGEIRWTDAHLERFFEVLKANELWDDTVVIVLADHGDEFFEHGMKGHKNNLYGETTRIPLIVKYVKGRPTGRDARLVSQVDLFPTICELAGVEEIPPQQGISILGPIPPRERGIHQELLTARYAPLPGGRFEAHGVRHWRGALQGDYKLITVAEDRRAELYDLRRDAAERVNLYGRPDAPGSALLDLVQRFVADNQAVAQLHGSTGEAELDEAGLERLRALGYIK